MEDISVTLASEAEAPACLALLPEAQGVPVELLIARRGGAFAGAAALYWRSWFQPSGFPVLVHVLPLERRRGVGRQLLAEAALLAAAETDGLWALKAARSDSLEALFMQACGFVPRRQQHHFQARIAALLEHISPLTARLRTHGRVPEGVRIAPLSDAPLEEVGWLVSAELGGGPMEALQRLRRRGASPDADPLDRSLAIMKDDHVAGVMLWRLEQGLAMVDARVVSPRWRNGWPNLLLLEASLLRARDEGVTEFRFYCDETVRDTLRLAQRAAAAEVASDALYYYAIAEI